MRTNLRFLAGVLLFILGWTLRAQQPQKIQYGPQVVLQVIKQNADGSRLIEHVGVTHLMMVPIEHPAPLNPGDLMVCQDFAGRTQDGVLVLAFRCGSERWVVQSLSVHPPKD